MVTMASCGRVWPVNQRLTGAFLGGHTVNAISFGGGGWLDLTQVMPKSTPEPVELQHVPGFAADILVNHAEAIRSFVVRCDTFFENVLGDEPCANLAAIIVRVAAPADGAEFKIRITGRLMLSRATPMDGVRLTKFIQDHAGE